MEVIKVELLHIVYHLTFEGDSNDLLLLAVVCFSAAHFFSVFPTSSSSFSFEFGFHFAPHIFCSMSVMLLA